MRELILLRHAHAEAAATGQADLDRPLSAEGLAEAEAAGRWLASNRLVPDCVLCSPSRRTRETLEAVLTPRGLTFSGLTERETAVLRLLAQGHDTAEVGRQLFYSERTVKNIIHDITSRLELRNRAHAVAYAIREGLI